MDFLSIDNTEKSNSLNTSVPITENKDFSCANEKNPTSISTCNFDNIRPKYNLLDLVNRFYRKPCTENNTHNKQKETVTKSKSATTQNKSISKSTKNKLKSFSKKSSKCQNKKKVKLAKVSQFINKQNLSEYAQSEKCIENYNCKMTDSESCMAIDKCTNLIEDPKSTDILVQPLNDNSDLNSLCEDFKTIEGLESNYNYHISDIFENMDLECALQDVRKCINFENLTVNEFCNFPEVKHLFVHLTTKYNFSSSPTLVLKENCILKNETDLLMKCIKNYVTSIFIQILSSKAPQSRKLLRGSVIKFAKRKMSIGEYSVIAELFKKREYLEWTSVIAKLTNLALLVIFHEYRKREAANFINNP